MNITEFTKCRSCNSENLVSVLNLGELYISDFISKEEREYKAPLDLMYCKDCTLVQLRHSVERDALYRDKYWYKSGINESMVEALRHIANYGKQLAPKRDKLSWVDIGSNDGTLLKLVGDILPQSFRLGFEPAWSLHEDAERNANCNIIPGYFPIKGVSLGSGIDIITSIAMFYDLDDPNEFVEAIKYWLASDGVWIVQFMDLPQMLSTNGFDNICHEHVTYWTEQSFKHLLSKHDLCIVDTQYNKVNGGSIRYAIKHGKQAVGNSFIDWEKQLRHFSHQVNAMKSATIGLLNNLLEQDKVVLGIAASTKANTLLQYYGINSTHIKAIVDRNPDKYGLMTVGSHIPIVSEQEIYQYKPDYFFALAWHFIDGFRTRYNDSDVKWIQPLPRLALLK